MSPLASLASLASLAPLAGAAGSAGEDIREIRGPVIAPAAHPWWPYVLAAVAVLAIGVVVHGVLRRRRRPLSPEAAALRALEQARGRIEREDPHGFSHEVSDAVRGYVEAAFALHAPRMTTPELLAELMSDTSPVAAHRRELRTFLEFCDLAKYARWPLSPGQMTGMLESAVAFVRATAAPVGGAA